MCYLSVSTRHEIPKAYRTMELPGLGGKACVVGRPEALSNLGVVTRYTRQHRVGGLGWKSTVTLGSLLGVGHSLGDPGQHEVRVEGAAWLGTRVGVAFGLAQAQTLGRDARRGVEVGGGEAVQFVLEVAHRPLDGWTS